MLPVVRSKRESKPGSLLKHVSDTSLFNTQQRPIRQTNHGAYSLFYCEEWMWWVQLFLDVQSNKLGVGNIDDSLDGSCTRVNLPITKITKENVNYYSTEVSYHLMMCDHYCIYTLFCLVCDVRCHCQRRRVIQPIFSQLSQLWTRPEGFFRFYCKYL